MRAESVASGSERRQGIRVGPLLRWLDGTSATIWVETERPCRVEVLDHSSPTFTIGGHHYGLVVIRGLEPGTTTPYEVRLDGVPAWPDPDSPFPASVIRTRGDGPLRIAFGSCRIAGPRSARLHLDRLLRRYDPDLDALLAYGRGLAEASTGDLPELLLLLGDQVYADDVPESTRRAMAARARSTRSLGTSAADFEDYTLLYRDSWTEPTLRWLLSTVSSAMIFDDHELVDGWDTSAAWVAEMRARPGWDERLTGALTSYWVYQHLGNLSPEDLERDPLFLGVQEDEDGAERVRTFIREADEDRAGSRWSYRRDLGATRLLVVDSRATRVLEEGRRDMLDPAEWRWLEANVAGADHLLLASSVPVVYAQGFHELQAWSERVAAGRWGRRASRIAERLRRALSLSGWPSFGASFERLMRLVGDLRSGKLGAVPRSITFLSGDVHHGYVARVEWPGETQGASPVHQVVASPFRNPLMPHERLAQRLAASRLGGRLLAALARAAGVPAPPISWTRLRGIDFANQIATLEVDADEVRLSVRRARHERGGTRIGLASLWGVRLASGTGKGREQGGSVP